MKDKTDIGLKDYAPGMKKLTWLCIFSLIFIGLALYFFDLNNLLFFDDDHFIIYNSFIREFSWENLINWLTKNAYAGTGRLSEYYRPFLSFSFAVNYAIDGVRPFGYHLANNLLHAINSVLVFWITLRYIFKKHWMAFLVALIFLIHPAQSENVAYVSGRGDLLSSFFMLGGLMFWLQGLEKRKYLYAILSSLALILALLSRENAIVFPGLALVFYIAFISGEKFWPSFKKGFFKVIPHLLIVAIYFILRLTVLNFRNFLNFGNFESESLYAQHLSIRLFTFLHALLEYLRTIFYPTRIYERLTFPISKSFFAWPVWPAFLGLMLLLILLMVLYKKKPNTFRIWFFAWGWFFAALVPSSGIIPTNVIIQDHRVYLALISIFILCIYYFDKLFAYLKLRNFGYVNILLIVGLIFYLCFFSWITIRRSIIWGKPVELFEETIRYEPEAFKAYNQIGLYYMRNGDYKKAKEFFLVSVKRKVKSPQAYYNMGDLKFVFGYERDLDRAAIYYKAAIEIDPDFRPAYRRLAELYMEKGGAEAVYFLKKLNEFNPDDANIHYNLASVLNLLGTKDEALKWAENGLILAEADPSAKKAFEELKAKILFSN